MTEIERVLRVYQGSDGEATKALYVELERLGAAGVVALNLFRACKCSERAKLYRRSGYRSSAYERKDWSIQNLSKALGADGAIKSGWGIDAVLKERGDPHHHVLYVDLPTGQVSFHNGARYDGPDYHRDWDGIVGQSADRICRWVARLLAEEAARQTVVEHHESVYP